MLEEILEVNGLDINGLADRLGIKRESLWRYRSGERKFRLSMEQIKELDQLLMKTGRRLADLPPDWILDKS